MKGFKDKLAFFISAVLSPYLIISIFSLLTIWHFSHDLFQFALWAGFLIGFCIAVPLLFIVFKVRKGKITDLHVALREQRKAPFIVATLGAIGLLVTYIILSTPMELKAMAFALIVNGVAFFSITKFWKISMHASTYASAVTISGLLISSSYFWLTLLLPLLIWARLRRKKHNFWQLFTGAIISSFLTAAVILIMR